MDLLESMGLRDAHVEDGRMYYAIHQDSQPAADEELQALAASCMARVLPHLQGYIWQHERFNLRSSLSEPPPWALQRQKGHQAPTAEPPSVWGSLRFGDNVEDEWFAVWLLLELTRQLPDISVRVWDEDGEFMLFEAATNPLPRWLDSPEKSVNRVWLRRGHLHVIPPPSSKAPTLPQQPTLSEALQVMRSGVINAHRSRVEAPVLERMAGYPAAARSNMHTVHCTLPLRAAHVLRHEPELIGPAVEAFYLRDPDDVKLAGAMRHFPPSEGMVTSAVLMSHIMYAQLRKQQHSAPRTYPMPLPSQPEFKAADLGMKIAAGLEIMVARGQQEGELDRQGQPDATASATPDQQNSSSSSSQRMPTEQQLASNPAWAAYRKSLDQKDYFQGNIPGSKAYKQRMAAAVSAFLATDAYAKSSAALAAPAQRVAAVLEAAPLPAGGAAAWQEVAGQLPPETSDALLQQHLHESFERQMAKREAEQAQYEAAKEQRRARSGAGGTSAAVAGGGGIGVDTGRGVAGGAAGGPGAAGATESEASEFARAMRGFMEHTGGFEGAELPSSSSSSAGRGTSAVSMDDRKMWSALVKMLGTVSAEGADDAETAQLQAMLDSLRGSGYGGASDDEGDSDYDGSSSSEGSSFFGDESGSGDDSDSDVSGEQWPYGKRVRQAASGSAAAAKAGGAGVGASGSQSAAHAATPAPAARPSAAAPGAAGASTSRPGGSADRADMDRDAGGYASDADSMHVSDLSIDESDDERDDLSIGGSGYGSDDDEQHAGGDRAFHAAYSQVLNEQLAATKLAETFAREPRPAGAAGPSGSSAAAGASGSAGGGAAGGLLPVDVDLNLVRNMMRSFEEQEGLPGPASNLAGLLGLKLGDAEAGRRAPGRAAASR